MNEPKPLIAIFMDPTKGLLVQSPILGDKVACVGLLELAKQIVIAHKAEPAILPVSADGQVKPTIHQG